MPGIELIAVMARRVQAGLGSPQTGDVPNHLRIGDEMKAIRTWFVVTDGARCRIMASDGPGRRITPLPDLEFHGQRRRPRDIMADRPGRTFDSFGKGRHAMAYSSDPARQDKRHFARRLADYLETELSAGAFDRLVIIAPPRTLGDLRTLLSKQVRDQISREVVKELTTLPTDQLIRHLQGFAGA